MRPTGGRQAAHGPSARQGTSGRLFGPCAAKLQQLTRGVVQTCCNTAGNAAKAFYRRKRSLLPETQPKLLDFNARHQIKLLGLCVSNTPAVHVAGNASSTNAQRVALHSPWLPSGP